MISGYMGMGGRTITAPGGYETGGNMPPAPLSFYYGPVVCDCGYGGRHSKLRHWYRLRFLKERW